MISIIVTLHNKEERIIDALQSLVSQSAQKWEAIIIDNASTDQSERLVRAYLIDRRMRYFRLQEKVSTQKAREEGLKLSKGEWILFLDGSDYLEPNALESLYLVLKKYGTKIAVGNYSVFVDGEKQSSNHLKECKITANSSKHKKITAVTGATLFSRDIAEKPELWSSQDIAYTEHICSAYREGEEPLIKGYNSNFSIFNFLSQKFLRKEKDIDFDPARKFSTLQHDGLKVEHLNLHIGDAHILKDVSVAIPKNKITCIIGPSGCGKSTLLRTFNRIIDSAEGLAIDGDIWLGEKNIVKLHGAEKIELRRHIGLVPQRPCPLPMSIFDNIAYGCKIHGITDKARQRKIVEHYLRSIGLWDEVKDRLSAPASSLSGGQQQRLCLARSLAVEPSVILADESTSALDPISSKKVEQLFTELKQNYTIVMVTHTLQQALRIADHVIFMYLGEVIEQGSARDVFNNPQHELTKKYLDGAFN